MKSDLIKYLENMSLLLEQNNAPFSLQGFVLEHGMSFNLPSAPRPWRGQIKACFRNAYLLAEKYPDQYIYCEGYAAGIVPVQHAWCVTLDGRVVEPTWRDAGHEYFGIPFKRKFVLERLLTKQNYGIIDDWESGFPLVKGLIPKQEFIYENYHSLSSVRPS